MAELPSKLYFRIGEVACLVGVEPHVLRYWEREFRSIRPTKSAKGQRVYSRKDVENLLRVRDLLYRDGFTIAGAKKKLATRPGEGENTGASEAASPDSGETAHVAESAPASGPSPPSGTSQELRVTLLDLRSEVESFLAELGAPSDERKS